MVLLVPFIEVTGRNISIEAVLGSRYPRRTLSDPSLQACGSDCLSLDHTIPILNVDTALSWVRTC